MSPRAAQRLTGEVHTGRFQWQPPKVSPDGTFGVEPIVRSIETPSGSSRYAETREITLPSAAAERARAIEREAFARGLSEGERTGEAAASARMAPVIQRLTQTIDDIAALRTGMLRRTERDIVTLAIAMAERILHREVSHDRSLLLAMARVAIDQLGDRVVATVHLNPHDVEAVTAEREPSAGDPVKIAADPSLPPGGCRIESVFGEIETGVDAQIQELTRSLLGPAGHHRPPHDADTHL
jgi:flagellar assembly protein FliH